MPVNQLSPTTAPLQTPTLDFDIAIAGGGIVGATLASALKDSGLKIAIIETQLPAAAAAKNKLTQSPLLSGMILEGIGVWEQILPQITTFEQISLCDGDYPGVVEFHRPDLGNTGKLPVPKAALGYVGEHRVMLSALHECLAKNPNFSWVCPAEVVEVKYLTNCAEIAIKQNGETRTIRTRLLVAADGSRSRIRTAANISTRGWKYWQSCIAITIKAEKPHKNIAFERFWPSGPMGVLPLPGNRCQVVWTAPHAEAKALQELDETEFLALLEQRTGGLLGSLELESERFLFPVQLMQSDRYVLPRLALIGDAAHCCHPVGGQGLNMGIRDAGAIAQILQKAHQKGEDIGDLRVLKRYHNWRKKENLIVLGFTDFLDRLFSNTWLPIVAFRRFWIVVFADNSACEVFSIALDDRLNGAAAGIRTKLGS